MDAKAPSLALAVLSDAVMPCRQVSRELAACELLVMPSILAVGPAFCAGVPVEEEEGGVGLTQTSRKVALHSVEAVVYIVAAGVPPATTISMLTR